MALLAAGLLAGLTAAMLAWIVAGLTAWSGPVDPPRARGSHHRPTPTSGGLGVLAGAAVGTAAGAWLLPSSARGQLWEVAVTVATAGGLGLVGALDDVIDFGARAKLLLQAAVALGFALGVSRIGALPIAGPIVLPLWPWLGVLGTALWIVVATNAVNFMDGANGVAGGALAIALAALAAGGFEAGEPAVVVAAVAGAAGTAGYLPWNLGGRLFQGDAGALFSGFLFAALAVVADRGGTGIYVYFGPLALLPFLTDVLLTLLYRARRGRRLLEAHRDHLYQIWLQRTGRSHAALAVRVAAVMAGYGLYALALQQAPKGARLPLFALGLLVCVAGWVRLRRGLEGG
jgi:UDP-GlcNAc:undecaprenyl-phosphate/decaprenyl-phosphate GlcNAc-1-phosphate transferase